MVLNDPDANKFLTGVAKVRAHLSSLGDQEAVSVASSEHEPRRELRQVQRRLTADEVQQLVARYQAGATVYELAEEFKCNRTTVSKKLKDAGITLRRTPPTKEQINEMVRLYESGLSMERTGERVGFTAHTVLKYLRERGVRTRDTHGRLF